MRRTVPAFCGCTHFRHRKMWIGGLSALRRPFLHLHTQFNRDLPWLEIDMDFMNLNQSAQGDREAGFIHTWLRLNRKVVVGHWSDEEVQDRIAAWMRVVRACADRQRAKFVRFDDNMREGAVTEGDKVSAEARFGYSVNAYGVGGGAHHTGYSHSVSTEHMEDLAEVAGVESVVIDAKTDLRGFKQGSRPRTLVSITGSRGHEQLR